VELQKVAESGQKSGRCGPERLIVFQTVESLVLLLIKMQYVRYVDGLPSSIIFLTFALSLLKIIISSWLLVRLYELKHAF